jgi:hypothetical protein
MPWACKRLTSAISTGTGRRPSFLPFFTARCNPALVRSDMEMRSCSASVAMIEITTSRMIPIESKNGSEKDRHAHGLAAQLDAMSVVHEPVEDAVGDGGVADLLVPLDDGNL